MKKYFLILIWVSITLVLHGQTLDDAIRYSETYLSGTARFIGVGGSMNAIGADYSTISSNPAGLGAYRSGQIVFTLGYQSEEVASRLVDSDEGITSTNDINKINISNAGIIWSKKPIASNWRFSNYTLGFNRIADFNQEFFFEGTTEGSIADRFLDTGSDGDGILDEFGDVLADRVGLIFTETDDDGTFLTNDILIGDRLNKSQRVVRSGSVNEIAFAWGGNYKDKLLIGASIGAPIVNYEEIRAYRETDTPEQVDAFNSLDYTERLETTGAGINFKLGLIYRPNRELRLGGAIHTPTFYELDDEFTTSLTYDVSDLSDPDNPFEGVFTEDSRLGLSAYRIITPWKFTGGLAYIVGKLGFLSADIEYLNYAGANFDLDVNDFDDPDNDVFEDALNDEIDRSLTSAVNIRVGAEIALNPFRLRAGYGRIGRALDTDVVNDIAESHYNVYSLGAGVRVGQFYFDAAYQLFDTNEEYLPYSSSFSPLPLVENQRSNGKGVVTVGLRI